MEQPPLNAPENAAATDEDRPPDPRSLGTQDGPAIGPGDDPAANGDDLDPASVVAPRRFIFETDLDGRLSTAPGEAATLLGLSNDGAESRPWRKLAADLALDPDGAIAAALAGRGAWSGLTARWPTPDGRRRAVTLSAYPVFDRGRTFTGFRGAGVIGDVLAATDAERAAQTPSAVPALTEASGLPAAGDDLETASVPADASGRALPPDMAATPSLSATETSAFDEIARRLRDSHDFFARSLAAQTRDVDGDDAEVEGVGPQDGSRDDFARILNRLPTGAVVLQNGSIVHANRAALDMSGHADVTALAAQGPDALFGQRLPEGEAAAAQIQLIAADGFETDVEARVLATEWRGAPAALVALKRVDVVSADALAALAREKELTAILDTATDGVITLDADGRVLALNRSAEALFGYDARDIVGSLFTLLLAPESRRVAFDYLDDLKATGAASLLNGGREALGLVRQGGTIPLFVTIGQIGGADETRFCAILRDISHWKRAEEELLAARRLAERASARKSEFLAKVSHEIRSPLNAIIGFAEVMIQERFGAIGNERYRDYLKDIHRSGGRLVGLVDDLLDLSKIEAGRLELDFDRIDLNDTVAQAVAMLQPQANRDHIIIRTSLARRAPLVTADRRSLGQILLNLVSHALRTTSAGSQVIVATALTDLGQAVVRVRDTGAGMSKKEVAMALEPFRASPISAREESSGLGLPLTKALVEANGGAFAIQSALGMGTVVEVAFPTAA